MIPMKRSTVLVVVLLLLALVVVFTESKMAPRRKILNSCARRCFTKSRKCLMRCERRVQKRKLEEKLMSLLWDDDDIVDDDDDDDDNDNSNPIDQKLIWENYRDELFKFFKRGGNVSGMQLMRNPISGNWDTDATKLHSTANQISAWGVEYSPRKDISVPQQYGQFLDSIDIDTTSTGNTESNPQLAAVQAAYDAAVARLKDIRDRCKAMFDRYPGTKPTYPEFEARRCSMVGNAESDVMVKQFELDLAKRESAGPHADLADARAKFTADKGTYTWTESILSNLERFKKRVDQGSTNSFSISVTKTSQSNTVQKEWKQLDTMSDFITVEDEEKPKKKTTTTTSKTKFTFTTSAANFKMDIRAVGYTNIPVDPDTWFNFSVLSKYKKGPFKSKVNFFGKKGTFNQMLKSLYVLYKPTVSLYVEKQDALSLKVLSSKTIKLGPFSADKVIVSDKPVSTKGQKKIYKVDFSVSTEEPIVVAVDNHVL